MSQSRDVSVRPVKEFSMSELVERTGVAAATVRYYLASGLLPPPRRAKANRFLYDERHVEVIRLIRLLQDRRNLSLETIGRMLPELLPDLTGGGEPNVFRPEMWGQLLAVHFPATTLPSLADRLQEAGMLAFAKHGYADVSVDDVCQAVGVAKGSFYRHFASKEELFFATVRRVGMMVFDTIGAVAIDDFESLTHVLADALGPYLVIVLDLASLAAQRRPGYTRAFNGLVEQLSHAVAERSKSAEVGGAEPQVRTPELVVRAIAEAMMDASDATSSTRAAEVLSREQSAQ